MSCWFSLNQIHIHSSSWDSVLGIVTSYGLDGPEFKCRQGQEIFSSPKLSRLAMGPNEAPSQWLVRFLPGRKVADQTHRFSKSHPTTCLDRHKKEAEI